MLLLLYIGYLVVLQFHLYMTYCVKLQKRPCSVMQFNIKLDYILGFESGFDLHLSDVFGLSFSLEVYLNM